MDKTEHNFMNVESFSQLPFLRPVPPKGSAIRLFGKEFSGPTAAPNLPDGNNADQEEDPNKTPKPESTRKFECHYCCRNFPTSQALGGHQNAHKRERQHAKRAHLQMGLPDPDHYTGLLGYSRLGSAPPYHTFNSSGSYSGAATARLYGSHGSYHQPINGSPLALWRIPTAHNTSPFNRDRIPVPVHQQKPLLGSQRGFGYESKSSMQDHVSLDLHL